MHPFPDCSRIDASQTLASDLLRSAEKLPLYENKAFYDLGLQATVFETVHSGCPDGFDWLVAEIRARIQIAPFSAIVSGLRFDEGNRLLVAINRAFGDLVARPYQKPRAQLIHYIQPATDVASATGAHTESERLHTDCADWPEPTELISMLCRRPDAKGGGRSQVLDMFALRSEIQARFGPDVVRQLEQEAVPWKLADYLGAGVVWHPVLTPESLRWRRYTINFALEEDGVDISDPLLEALDALGQTVAQTDRMVDFLLKSGELLFIDNRRCIHGRTPITGNPKISNRLMLRSWIRASEK